MTQKDSVNVDSHSDTTLRSVDLNLITVFDAVMQEQNITRAAQTLGMSQPAVSNAVARLKHMFNDELFVRNGRGIKPTQRARQLFGPLRQAIQLIKNELPTSIFVPETSQRTFRLMISSPCDMRFAPHIMNRINELAPNIKVQIETESDQDITRRLRYQEINFVIDHANFTETGFSSTEMFSDELVVVASKKHPRIGDSISAKELQQESHAVLHHQSEMHGYAWDIYKEGRYREAYQGVSLSNVLYVVENSDLVAIAPRWIAESYPNLKILTSPLDNNRVSGFLSWHVSAEKDKGHLWMREQLLRLCGELLG